MRFSPQFVAKTSELGARNPSHGKTSRTNHPASRLGWGLLAVAVLLPVAALATGDKASRYPFDPVCPWGRLANGKGMIHRCISEDEARTLATEGAPKEDGATKSEGASKAEKSEAEKSAPPASAQPLPKGYELTLGPIVADSGTITVGRLGVPMSQYRKCIDDNGGLSKPSGKIVVKFLVRAERLRAEGASADGHENVSSKAADCIAAVVDRRQVGTPSVPMTGAKLTFSLHEKK